MRAVPITEVPVRTVLEQSVYPDRQNMVGKRYEIAFLESEKGKALNGQLCQVVGFERDTLDARINCRLDDGQGTIISLKYSNLMPTDVSAVLEQCMGKPSAPLSDDTIAACVEQALAKHNAIEYDRQDIMHRLGLYQNLLNKLQSPNASLTDSDYCLPCGVGCELLSDDSFGVLMKAMKPGCVGIGIMDMRYVDRGLKGDGPSTSRLDYQVQMQKRFDEYPIVGFCTECQMYFMERH